MPIWTTLKKKLFENILGKRENADVQHFFFFFFFFFLFPQLFCHSKNKFQFQSHLFCRLQMLSIWTGLQFCRWVKSQAQHSFFMPTWCTTHNHVVAGSVQGKKWSRNRVLSDEDHFGATSCLWYAFVHWKQKRDQCETESLLRNVFSQPDW